MEDAALDLLKSLLPAALVLGAAVVVFRNLERRQHQQERYQMKLNAFSHVMPLRTAAYERAVLLLERLHPASLLARQEPLKMTCAQLKAKLLADVNEEYDHNAVQQLYVSETAWNAVMNAKSAVTQVIQKAAEATPGQLPGVALVETIIQNVQQEGFEATTQAIRVLRQELNRSLG